MKADLYVQGHYWASINLAQDSLLALLAQGIITRATHKALQLQDELEGLEGVHCCITLSFPEPLPETADTAP